MADAHWGPMHMTFCYQSRHAHLSLQPWIIVLLSLSPYASAHAKNRISAFWFEARAESGSRAAPALTLPQFITPVTEILSTPRQQNVLQFFLLHPLLTRLFFIWLHPERRDCNTYKALFCIVLRILDYLWCSRVTAHKPDEDSLDVCVYVHLHHRQKTWKSF